MKKILSVIFAVIILAGCFSACTSSKSSITLCDYNNIIVPYEEVSVSSEEVTSAISMQIELCSDNICTDNIVLTDKIAQNYFDCSSADEAKQYVIETIVKNRYIESVYSYIISNSNVNDDKSCEDYVGNTIEKHKEAATELSISFDEYLNQYYGTTESELYDSTKDFYEEMQIVKGVLSREGITASESAINDKYSELAEENNVSVDEIKDGYSAEYVEFLVNKDLLYLYIAETYSAQIAQAINQAKSNLM